MLIHERFHDAAHRYGARPAFEFAGAAVSYADAVTRVDALARGLRARLDAGDRVALSMRKSPDAIMTMLACLRAGLAYVPVDASSPAARRSFIAGDAGVRAVVTDDHGVSGWDVGSVGVETVVGPGGDLETLDDLAASGGPGPAPATDADPDDLAYVLYTSGSTGEPKGVAITHRNAAAFVDWALEYAGLQPSDRVAVHAPLHFDLPVFDVYAGLASGATVCPVDERTTLFPQALLRFLREESITVLYAVPSALVALRTRSTLAEGGLPDLRLLLYAGEEFHPKPLAELMSLIPAASVHNLYGPIETNVVTALRIEARHLRMRRIPIGRPISNTTIFLLGPDGRVVEGRDEEGEIVVSGPSVTPGYLNRDDLTAAARAVVRRDGRTWDCHRTGDFATWRADGTLQFLGRRDGLVKTRGFRVELGEIETALLDHPEVVEAAVVAEPHTEHTNVLLAFVVVRRRAAIDAHALADWCRRTLPGYMVPQEIHFHDDFPRTSTGKISRRTLAATHRERTHAGREAS